MSFMPTAIANPLFQARAGAQLALRSVNKAVNRALCAVFGWLNRNWIFVLFVGVLFGIAAYFRHLVWTVSTLASADGATTGQIVLGILGALVPPGGVIHGILLFLGG